MCPPTRYTASRPSVNSTRLRRSDTAKMFFSDSLSIWCPGYARTSAVPPAAAIFSAALPLNLWARIVSFFEMSPRASTLMLPVRPTRPCSRSSSGVTSLPASKRSAIASRLTTSYSTRNGLWNPRFGTRRCSGIWPPSNPRLCLKPERDFAPLCPRPAVLPLPEPWPRPIRFFACLAPFGGRRLLRFIALLPDFHQVTDLQDHASCRRRVRQLHRVADAPQAHALDDPRLVPVEADRALAERDRQPLAAVLLRRRLLRGRRHYRVPAGSSSRPRSLSTLPGSRSSISPWKVARTTLWWLADPIDLVSTFWMPADSTTARTAPPAMMPVPSGAGWSSTCPAPKRPRTGCGTVVPFSGTRISDFFAASIPFLIAEGTSFALPTPKPTTPWPSPTTTSALKLRFLPPLTTLVTRLMLTTVSFRSSCDASIFSLVSIIKIRVCPC